MTHARKRPGASPSPPAWGFVRSRDGGVRFAPIPTGCSVCGKDVKLIRVFGTLTYVCEEKECYEEARKRKD